MVPSKAKSEYAPELLDSLLGTIRANPDEVLPRLELAEYYLCHDCGEDILDAIAELETNYPFDDKFARGYYNRLLAFGHARRRQFAEAEEAARRGLGEFPQSLDFYFVLCLVHLSLKEFEPAIESGERFLELWRKMKNGRLPVTDFCYSGRDVSQVFNMLGTAYGDTGDTENAGSLFRDAIAADPGNHLPYLNLADLYRRSNDAAAADATIARGLKRCRQVNELRLMARTRRQRATVSACLMVKDEEELLPGCLESIRDWVDEIIVVDTGSTDRTIEIAESFGARVFQQPWEGDFSKHRNYSMEHATKEWLFIIDADERVDADDVPLIRKVLNQSDYDIVSINVYNVMGDSVEQVTFLPSIRFFRRRLNLKYAGIVHNLLAPPADAAIMRADICLKHYGYGISPEKMKAKVARSRELLEKQIAADPQNALAHFNYAQLLRGQGGQLTSADVDRIRHSASRAIALTDPADISQRHIHIMAHHQLAWMHSVTGRFEEAERLCHQVLTIRSDYLDALLLLGQVYLKMERPRQAEQYLERYLDAQAQYRETSEIDSVIMLHPRSVTAAHYGLGLAAEQRQDPAAARQYYQQAYEAFPGYLDIAVRYGRLALADGDSCTAEECLKAGLDHEFERVDAALALADLYLQQGKTDEAFRFADRARQWQPNRPETLLMYGRVLLAAGRLDDAVEILLMAAALGEMGETVHRLLGDALYQLGRYDDALDSLYRLRELYGETGFLLNDIGDCHFKAHRWQHAEQCYRRALAQDGSLTTARRHLGLVCAHQGKTDEAIVALEDYLEAVPDDVEIRCRLGELYADRRQYGTAVEHFEQCLQADPHNLSALFGLSECYLDMGHKESAIQGYQRILQIDSSHQPAAQRLAEILHHVSAT